VFTYDERSTNSHQDSHKYEGQIQDFFFQATDLLTASRRVQSTGGHPALDQMDSLKERKNMQYETDGRHVAQGSVWIGWARNILSTLKFSLVLETNKEKNILVYESFAADLYKIWLA
jgi:hypothetical protein